MGIQPEIKVKRRGREREKRREREKHGAGGTSPATGSILYCLERPFIPFFVHRDQWVIQNYAVLAVQTYQNQAFLSAYLIVYTSLR